MDPPVKGHAHAQPSGLLRLDVHRIFQPVGIEIMMVGHGRASGHQKFGQGKSGGEAEGVRFYRPGPDRIQRLQPGKQLLVDGLRVCPRQGLEKVVMGVDEAGQDHPVRRIKDIRRPRGRFRAGGDKLDDPAIVDHEPAAGAFGQNGQRVFDPKHGLPHFPSTSIERTRKCLSIVAYRQFRFPARLPQVARFVCRLIGQGEQITSGQASLSCSRACGWP